ncbi:MAG: hypothetical protein ABI541_13590 [Betaproteobacteria bacterium]
MTSIRSSLLLAAFVCAIPSVALAQEAYTNRRGRTAAIRRRLLRWSPRGRQ